MQKFTRIAALLLVTIGIVLAVLAFSIGRRALKPSADGVASLPTAGSAPTTAVPVVVAAVTLPAGAPLVGTSLRLASWAQRPADGYGSVDAVAGRVPLIDIPAGAPLMTRELAHGVAMALKPGERAMAVPVDGVAGAGNRILAGDYVDVFVSLKAPTTVSYQPAAHDAAVDASQTRLLLSRLHVLAYGDDDLPSTPGKATPAAAAQNSGAKPAEDDGSRLASGSPSSSSTNKALAHTALLAVPVDKVNQLMLAVQNGRLLLGLRAPGDLAGPDDALFAAPQPVLAARGDLSAAQRQQLMQPENRAYAGVNGSGLAGQVSASARPARAERVRANPTIQIIRGSSDDTARVVRTNP